MNRRGAIASGSFALLIGLLLRSAVGSQDDTDWNGAVRTFLDVFPWLLIVGGALTLLITAISVARSG